MPIYDYKCGTCGWFQAPAPISRFADPGECPTCGATSERALSTPQLSTIGTATRAGHLINERASHEPKRAKANGLTPSGPRIRRHAPAAKDGSRSFPTKRPWMISH
ncbi:MAG: FmdB family zinc ribbon protein [Pseudomonadota bacterium]